LIGVNDCYRLVQQTGHPRTHCYGCDSRWWRHYIQDITRDFDGVCWTQNVQWPETQPPEQWGIRCLTSENKPGLSTEWPIIHQGRNSGFQALNLAGHLGNWDCRIILLGYDMQMEGDKRHWFGPHPEGMEVNSNYPDFISAFQSTLPVSKYGIEVWNCTRSTALRCYPWYDLDDVVEKLSGADPEEVQQPGGDSLRHRAEHHA